ncbi:MAG: efflux RND transporter periplasmic adaptor subunit [Polymorphobacter sp.]
MALLLVASCSKPAAEAVRVEPEPIRVALAVVQPDGGVETFSATGTVRFKRETALSFNTNGRLAEINVVEGQAVTAGQPLARLDPTGLAAASAAARAEAARAEADLTRLRKLAQQGWITRPRLESAEAAAAAARARVDQTSFDVRFGQIVAPTSGIVLRRLLEPGQIVSAGQPVVVIGEMASGFVLRVPLTDTDMVRVRIGQRASVLLLALSPQPILATVGEVGARSDDRTGTFQVELRLPATPGLRSGLIGRATLFGGTTLATGTLKVPATAVFAARADEGFVYVFDAGTSTVRTRMVSIGTVSDNGVEIVAGLRAGDKVVRSGVDRLRDGLKVRVGA